MPTQVDDELEKYAAKPSGDDELEKYAQKPAPKSGSLEEYLSTPHTGGTDNTNELEKQVEKENLTPRMRAAVSSGAAKMAAPTRFEKEHTPAPEDTGVWGRLKQGAGDVGRMITGMAGAGPIPSPVPTPGMISGIASSYASRAVPNKGQEGLAGARSTPYNLLATGAQGAGIDPTGMEASAEHGDPTRVLTHAAAQATPVAAAELARIPAVRKAGGAVIDAAKAIPDKTALALRNEETGALKPAVHATARMAGGLAGGGAGHLIRLPAEGAVAGYAAGPAIADRLIPNLPTDIPVKPGATSGVLPSIDEFYANRAEDLAKRGKEQGTIDKTAAREAKANPPFETPGSAPATLPSADEFYEHRGMDLLKRGAQEEALAKKQAAAGGGIPKIVSPTEGEPRTTGSEGRPATWTNEFVQEQAGKGNRDAISQAVRRGLELPANARYVMGDPDFPRAVLNPREVTLFSPEGIPIRNKANAQAEAQQGTIPTISRTPRGTIPNIGEQNVPRATISPETAPEPVPIAAKPPVEGIPEPTAPAEAAKPEETAKPVRDKNETNAIRAELSEYNQKAKKWSDKIASARPSSWKAQRDWMDNLEAADKRVGQLKDALENGTPIKIGQRGATKEELTVSYRNLSPEDKAQVDDLASTFSSMKDSYAKKYFSDQYQLDDKSLKGLPTKEKLARFVTRKPEESPAMQFIRSLDNPEAEPAPSATPKPPAPGIQNIGAPSITSRIPMRHQMIAETPATIEPVLKETGWQYEGRNTMGLHTITEPGTNIKLELWDREMNPDFIRRKIAEKEKQFGTPKKAPKANEGESEVPF